MPHSLISLIFSSCVVVDITVVVSVVVADYNFVVDVAAVVVAAANFVVDVAAFLLLQFLLLLLLLLLHAILIQVSMACFKRTKKCSYCLPHSLPSLSFSSCVVTVAADFVLSAVVVAICTI